MAGQSLAVAAAAPAAGFAALALLLWRAARGLGAGSGSPSTLSVLARAALDGIRMLIARLPEEVRGPILGAFYLSLPMSVVGALGGIGWKFYGMVQARLNYSIERNCKVVMTFNNSDKHYDVVVDYIGTRCAVETGKLLASTKPRTKPSWQERLAYYLGGKQKTPTLYYQPDIQAFSDCFVWTDEEGKSHKIWISRHVEKPQFRSDNAKGQRDPETLILTMWWTTDPKPLKNFMSAALSTMLHDDSEGKVDIYVKHMWLPMWTKAISKDKRDRDSIVLDENLADYVVEDVRHFFSKKTADWYHNAGIPYRRGYLLYGPPGCGKTSFAQVLAGELGLDVCLMNLSNQDMNDDDLAELLRAAPPRSMLLLEDVDAIFVERSAKDKNRGGGVSFSGLLNALDGAAAQEGCVIMLTTNHKDRLDEALIRPGRCDVHIHIQKASQNQARRMYCRFFSKEAKISSIDSSGTIVTAATHGFKTGDAVICKVAADAEHLLIEGHKPDSCRTFVAGVPDAGRLRLFDSAAQANSDGISKWLHASGGRDTKLLSVPEAAARFSTRIPEKQVSMAKLQAYLMKQKLEAEQHFKALREKGELPSSLAGSDLLEDETKHLYNEAVDNFAAEAAVMNVHELLDVKVEAEEASPSIYDHLHRLGLEKFAPFFEHFGIREKRQITSDLKDRMETWDPDLKTGPQRDRLRALLEGENWVNSPYSLADLSVLRDRFLASFQSLPELPEASPSTAAPPPLTLDRATSAPEPGSAATATAAAGGLGGKPSRLKLLRQTSGVNAPETKLTLLDMAHRFQEALESNGKTTVSLWQLDVHFQRFKGDPHGALQHCHSLRRCDKDRLAEERAVRWMTTHGFLNRIGLGDYAWKLEDQGMKLWVQWKTWSKDDLKNKAEMSDADATLCHAVLDCNKDRPDLVRKFQSPEFADLQSFFRTRFPEATEQDAQKFAVRLTDGAGTTHFSCLQVDRYLEQAKTVRDALNNLEKGLPLPAVAEAARVRPEAPLPPEEPDDWVYKWLKEGGLAQHSGGFIGQALSTREAVLGAPIDADVLQGMGVNKLGERCKILKMLEEEKAK